MTDMFKAMIALQEQALELQRKQIAFAQQWMQVGTDTVAAQKQAASAMDASAKVMSGWLALWGVKG
jgi:hypothetical protein